MFGAAGVAVVAGIDGVGVGIDALEKAGDGAVDFCWPAMMLIILLRWSLLMLLTGVLAAVACSFFAAMDDPAPQIYRFFFWTSLSVVFASLYLFVILPNLHDFPMLVLAFAVPFICVGTIGPAEQNPQH